MLKDHSEVCHITCFPNETELAAFQEYQKLFLWMNTSINQAKTNILIRRRKRDFEDPFSIFNANEKYYFKFENSTIAFTKIDNYGNNK